MLNNKEYYKILNKKEGYFIINIINLDLNTMRNLVEKHWIKKIEKNYPALKNIFKKNKIINYHKNSDKIDHSKFWVKKTRILSKKDVEKIKKLQFFKTLEKIFGPILISDTFDGEKIGHEEMYWRIVRPNQNTDRASLHADKWFWDLNERKDFIPPKNKERIKVWIPLHCSKYMGLQIVPFSQLKEFDYQTEIRQGIRKPIFDTSKYNLKVDSLDSLPTTAVIFHDNVLHGAALNEGEATRISLEFTMFVNLTNN